MNIEICKWFNNADSPVLFMIDDLANVWVDANGNGKVELGEDWGYHKNAVNSSFRFLNDEILKVFPEVKTTFFTPVGVRVGMIENPKIKSISKLINCDKGTKDFFREIHNDQRFEIAYHGTTHGKVGKTSNDFKQEWELFENVEEAINTINGGKEIYKEVFGQYPKGGKYCGYTSNIFSDESIDKTNFLWWCRYCNLDTKNAIKNGYHDKNVYGNDGFSITNFDIKKFGDNEVIDIPSTVPGNMFNALLYINTKTFKGKVKAILKKHLIHKKINEIEYLLNHSLVISIQEHIAAARDDGRRQTPNIFDDKESLKLIFNYLKGKNVWYCTGSELAEYVNLRDNIKLTSTNDNKFSFEFNLKKEINRKVVTLRVMDSKRSMVKVPNGQVIKIKNRVVNVPMLVGEYELI